ncbi:hypothetical protein BSU00_09695 [Tenacibaculum sp. SG-28]|nr:hypothetical protein BSU00_09695 [Tenacibaculum sp. SG-28]
MFSNSIFYEIKMLLRNNWLLVLFLGITLLIGFATFNGTKTVAKRQSDITKMEIAMQQKDSVMLGLLSKINKKEKVDVPYWQLPSEPMTVGYRYPRLAVMQPDKLAFIATGQSDMYTHFKSPTVYGNNFALDYAEMVNPVQLLFGSFDLAFVIIFIVPLFIIAFTYNVLTKEKELGTLKLLGAQPISIWKWLWQKMAIRYTLFTAITIVSILLSMLLFARDGFQDSLHLLGLLVITAVYIGFWFVVAFGINIRIASSSKSALTFIGIWLLIVIVLPATINQLSTSLYPTPSRLKMINEIRQVKKENEEKQNEILNDYLRNHPELAQENKEQKFGFWHNYFASEKILEEKTKPLVEQYESQLRKQQQLVGVFTYISPAILMQQTLNAISGTSEKHYNDFKKQVYEFSETWRAYLIPMLFKGEKFTVKNYEELPKYKYENRISSGIWLHTVALGVFCFVLLFMFSRKQSKKKLSSTILKSQQ